MSGVTAVLSNLVSNVPAVLVLRSFVDRPARSAARLAGGGDGVHAGRQFHHLGSVANLIVVQRARQDGVEVRFGTYFAAGAPLTVLTILAGIALL